MIQSFQSKSLQELFERGKSRKINPNWHLKLKLQLAQLDAATTVEDMGHPLWNLHELQGELAGIWAVKVSPNWRLTFRFEEGDAYDVDLEDYH